MKKGKTNIIAERKISIFLMLIIFTLVQIAFSFVDTNQSKNYSTVTSSKNIQVSLPFPGCQFGQTP